MKAPYSLGPTDLPRKWTAHMNTPPTMLATISQPLWRKNDARCALSVTAVGTDSTFSASMGLGKLNAHLVQSRDLRNFTNIFLPRSSSRSEIHSSAVCACAMSPGPSTTLGMPARDNTDASQK